jgi:hypothetical protein
VACAATLIATCALPVLARASTTEESILMDDQELVYSSSSQAVDTLEQLAGLGVDRVKVSVVWTLIAPDASSTQRPSFDASDPGDYGAGAWTRYDLIDRTARELGMQVYFMIAPPAPLWALPANQPNQGPPLGRAPNLTDLHDFVEAVGRRYSGTYPDPDSDTAPASPPPSVLGVPLPLPSSSASTSTSTSTATLPAVDFWGIWNEPNERSWLNPWYRKLPHGKRELIQPEEYRGIVDASWSALESTGHEGNTILVGETANVGVWQPVPFVRALYCVARNDEPLRGSAASAVGCPTSGNRAQFVADNPGLFDGGGFAHHPYSFDTAPNRPYPDPSWVTLDNLAGFEKTLNRIFAAYAKLSSGGVPLYMTEWGYKTDPPNPYAKTTTAEQAEWLDEGAYMTWQDPYVQGIAQFELVDSAPKPGKKVGSRAYWNTFQTGLELLNGTHKPSFDAYRIPVWVPRPRHGSGVTVWGQLRPADHGTLQYGVIEFAPRGSNTFEQLREVQTASSEGFLLAHVAIPSAGRLRLAWLTPAGGIDYSRTVTIS